VVVTNGTEPLAVAGGGEARSFMPLRTEVKGVNGAGDSLAAGTILGLVEGLSLHEAIRFGLAAAAMMLEAGSILATSFSQDALAERIGAGPKGRERIAS
jgi:pseudouridine kinase